MPMLLNSGLDQLKVVLGDGSFSNGNGQHCHYIAKRERGRQQKMHGDEKKITVGERLETARIVG